MPFDAIQTRPFKKDEEFLDLQARISRLLAPHGFRHSERKGSATWIGAKAKPKRSQEAFFKLLFLGKDSPFVFGIRKDFVEEEIPKLAELPWPRTFGVMPQTRVAFLGFNIQKQEIEKACKRIEKILSMLPAPDPSVAIQVDDKKQQEEFNDALDRLV